MKTLKAIFLSLLVAGLFPLMVMAQGEAQTAPAPATKTEATTPAKTAKAGKRARVKKTAKVKKSTKVMKGAAGATETKTETPPATPAPTK